MSLPDWNETDQRLRALGASGSASQCHGVLCGLLAVGYTEARSAWLAETVGDEVPGDDIDQLYTVTVEQLDDTEFGFELLLPADEETDLDERTRALADWAGGLSFGVVCGGRHADDLPAEVAEFVRDTAEIAGVTPGADDEGDEADYAELVEYLRAGTLLMRTECRRQSDGQSDGQSEGSAERDAE